MSSHHFKEYLETDLETFINLEEFAEIHRFQYKIRSIEYDFETAAIVSNEIRSKSIAESKINRGLYAENIKVFYKSETEQPRQGQTIKLDGELYSVISSKEQHGITVLIMEGYKQR